MEDAQNTVVSEVAPQTPDAPSEQVVPTDQGTQAPEAVSDTADTLLAGKYKSTEELESAYLEAQRKITELAQTKVDQVPTGYKEPDPIAPADDLFDESTSQSLTQWYARQREAERAAEFERKHKEELADPLLAGAVKHLISQANREGKIIDQEQALKEAQAELNKRINPQVKTANQEGLKEGQELALKKQQAGAVGDTSQANPVVDDADLSAADYATKYGFTRAR